MLVPLHPGYLKKIITEKRYTVVMLAGILLFSRSMQRDVTDTIISARDSGRDPV